MNRVLSGLLMVAGFAALLYWIYGGILLTTASVEALAGVHGWLSLRIGSMAEIAMIVFFPFFAPVAIALLIIKGNWHPILAGLISPFVAFCLFRASKYVDDSRIEH